MKSKIKYGIVTLALVIMTLGFTAFSGPLVARGSVRVYPRYRVIIPAPYYYYDPFWYGYGWYGPPAYVVPHAAYGTIKTEVEPKKAEVYVNGGYVGTADKFRGVFHGLDLRPGNYELEIRAPHYAPLRMKIYVAANKTLKIKEQLRPLS